MEKFEAALGKIGANARLLDMVPGEQAAIHEMFSEFANVFGPRYGFKEWAGKPVTGEYAVESVVSALRNVLGIAELTRLRSEVVRHAINNLSI